MSQEQHTQSKDFERIASQVGDNTPVSIIWLIVSQLARAKESAAKIEKEGLVVRDMKGSVIAHPAVAIELAATKCAADLLAKHKEKGI